MEKRKHFSKKFNTIKETDNFLENHDLGEYFLKYGKVKKPKIKKINIDLPEWFLKELDFEAVRAGISRQPLIKLWLLQKLNEERKNISKH